MLQIKERSQCHDTENQYWKFLHNPVVYRDDVPYVPFVEFRNRKLLMPDVHKSCMPGCCGD
jgi:hypothetical protein